MPASTDQYFSLYRSALKSAVDLTAAFLGSAERVRNHQLRSIQDALSDRAETAKRLESAQSFEELLAIQIGHGQATLEQTIRYWAGWYETASENQIELMRQAQAGAAKLGESAREALAGADGSEPPIVAAVRAAAPSGSSAEPAAPGLSPEAAPAAGATADAGIRPADDQALSKTA